MSLLLLFSGGEGAFVISKATHSHSADNVAILSVAVLEVQDATHGHAADNVGVLAVAQLVIQDAIHGGGGAATSPDMIYADFRLSKKISEGKYIKV